MCILHSVLKTKNLKTLLYYYVSMYSCIIGSNPSVFKYSKKNAFEAIRIIEPTFTIIFLCGRIEKNAYLSPQRKILVSKYFYSFCFGIYIPVECLRSTSTADIPVIPFLKNVSLKGHPIVCVFGKEHFL